MGRIIVTQNISVDGVVESPGPGDLTDFRHKGWVFDFDRVDGRDRFKLDEAFAAEALLLGRVTYETLAAHWPALDGRFADRLNAMPKYAVSSTLERAEWANSTIVRGGLDEVAQLRERVAGDLLIYGSVQLARGLIERGLLDELRLLVYPVALRSGITLFGESPAKLPLRFLDSRTFDGGFVLLSYAPEAPPTPA